MRALIVDDSKFIRQHMRQLLDRMGVSSEDATDGREALQLLNGTVVFDLMLLDVHMPEMGGMECVKALRDGGTRTPMKVIMVTSEVDNAFICQALENGADEFLMKPFTLESLREKLAIVGLAA